MLNIYTVCSPNAKQCLSNTDARMQCTFSFSCTSILSVIRDRNNLVPYSHQRRIFDHATFGCMGRPAKWLNLDQKSVWMMNKLSGEKDANKLYLKLKEQVTETWNTPSSCSCVLC